MLDIAHQRVVGLTPGCPTICNPICKYALCLVQIIPQQLLFLRWRDVDLTCRFWNPIWFKQIYTYISKQNLNSYRNIICKPYKTVTVRWDQHELTKKIKQVLCINILYIYIYISTGLSRYTAPLAALAFGAQTSPKLGWPDVKASWKPDEFSKKKSMKFRHVFFMTTFRHRKQHSGTSISAMSARCASSAAFRLAWNMLQYPPGSHLTIWVNVAASFQLCTPFQRWRTKHSPISDSITIE